MAFSDLFKEFIPIRVDEDIYLRQHEPEKDARPFWEIYYDEEHISEVIKNLKIGMRSARSVQSKAV